MAIIVAIEGDANAVAILLIRDNVGHVLKSVQDFAVLADQKCHVVAIEFDVHVPSTGSGDLG